MSIEHQLLLGLNFESVIEDFENKKLGRNH